MDGNFDSLFAAWKLYRSRFGALPREVEQSLYNSFMCGAAVVLGLCTSEDEMSDEQKAACLHCLPIMRDEITRFTEEKLVSIITGVPSPIPTEPIDARPPLHIHTPPETKQ